MQLPIGSLVNAGAIVAGGLIGILLNRHFPERIRSIVFQALGLCVLIIGIGMSLKAESILPVTLSLILGGIIGEAVRIDRGIERLADRAKSFFKSSNPLFSQGFITTSLIYCIGAMAIVGSLTEGLTGERDILYTKAILDGFSAIVFAATYGFGVLLSAIPVFIYQAAITIFASSSQAFFTDSMTAQLTSTGGILILGIGINILNIRQIDIANLLPSLVIIAVLSYLF
ncbi:MAG: DUF554 domain-containing protein [Deltaproteobacteria bacterium]|nr:DUF554 domain-containing protein [Deltaproteobacteria bacterium]